ncbi:GPO family capsid scaffolding protein [Sphingomonas sp.]|uniref:GPO family capsid scaffolding protein n=1 Tax=Sphingomonas sp. TaxID=28214 RepID=UPI003F6ECA4D
MKTKPFLLATAGSTVDGRVIDDKMIEEMASSYNPQTYGARLNIEHIRGISGEKPFRAYGDVVELSTAQVDVDFNGKVEKRLGLYGVFDVTDDAKALNGASQKVYPSIEIEPNFGGKGFAYLMGCALTDSPAAIATERLQFNRSLPGTIKLSRDESAAIEFPEGTGDAAATGLLTSLTGMFDKFAAKFGGNDAPKPDDKPGTPAPAPATDFNALRPLLEDMANEFSTGLTALRTEVIGEVDRLSVQVKKMGEEQESAPAPNFRQRPQGTGKDGDYSNIF